MTDLKDKIEIDGIQSMGYGIMPKAVTKDKRLTIEAKAIYAYFVSYAGAGNSAFPKLKTILEDLTISEKRFYKHRKMLIDCGYISVEAFRNEKSVIYKNVYTLHTNPQSIDHSENDIVTKGGVSVKTTDRVSVKTTDRGIRQNDCDKLILTSININNRQVTTDDDENINKTPKIFENINSLIQSNETIKFLAQELLELNIPENDLLKILDYFDTNCQLINPDIIQQQLLWCKEKNASAQGISSFYSYFINGYQKRLQHQDIDFSDRVGDSLAFKLGLTNDSEELPVVPLYNWLKG